MTIHLSDDSANLVSRLLAQIELYGNIKTPLNNRDKLDIKYVVLSIRRQLEISEVRK